MTDYNLCPNCGLDELEVNTWEAWCNSCDWRITDENPAFKDYRAAALSHRGSIAEVMDNAIQTALAPLTPTPKELQARREGLGLSQQQLATALHVAQSTFSQWEKGKRRIPGIRPELNVLEAALQDITNITYLNGRRDGHITTYLTNEEWWTEDEHAQALQLPAVMHRVATARAAAALHQEGITTTID